MSMSTEIRRMPFLGSLLAAALAVGALTVPLQPANAQAWAGFSIGPFGIGVGVPGPVYTYPYYPPYGYYYPPRYYYPY